MKKKKIILAVVAVLLITFLVIKLWPEKKDLVFSTAVVEENTVQNTVTATGTLEPVDEVEVGTQVSGIVEKLYVDYNSHVKKGQLLAELDKSTLNERHNQAQTQVMSAESQLRHAQQAYNRTKELFEAKAATKVEMEDAENTLVQAKSTLQNAQTSLREAKVNLGYAEIYSPIDGVILSKDIEEGQTVASSFNTPTLFVIAKDLKNMQVEANVDEADIGQVKVGQKCTFTVDAYNGETFTGEVKEIRLKPTTTSNVVTYTVVIQAPNPEEKLYPGMTASISVITKEETSLCVPLQALQFEPTEEIFKFLEKPQRPQGDKPPFQHEQMPQNESEGEPKKKDFENFKQVWIKNGNSLRPSPVETGLDDGVNAIIKGGHLQKGDTVVLSATVQVKASARGQGANLFGPPKRNGKNNGGGRPPM
ncbi:MAG: efflux RND transporter periplasmic adaptor subunit [Bacteroidales bacterium]|nr:efflux RND transporter periplasmic adaptor subunit [Bacteroidales bacterium]